MANAADASTLHAGVAKVEITDREAGPANDPLYVKALVLKAGARAAAIVTVDAVAIAEIGTIPNRYLSEVRAQLSQTLDFPADNLIINASHCHGSVCADVAQRTVWAVREALEHTVPVTVGAGTGHEGRIMENRRLRLRDGREGDVRHAYPLQADEDVIGVGPVDPEIGVLRLDRTDGRPMAVLYNFACHPILGVPSGGNTADIAGFASDAVETGLGGGATALFVQGCAGDVNPAGYKDLDYPRNAEHLGNLLGLSTLKAVHAVRTREDHRLSVIREVLSLPLADLSEPIASLEAGQARLLASLKGTTLNLKAFVQLFVRHSLFPRYPSAVSHRYLHQKEVGLTDLVDLDARNRADLERYIANVRTMETLVRTRVNLDLLRKHQARYEASEEKAVDVDVMGLRVGDFVLVTFPGELSVQIGLDIKKASPHALTFLSGCSNGYIYYSPTVEQMENRGGAQEDSDCPLAPEWRAAFEACVSGILKRI